jgi:hypothetical protein
MSGRSKGCAAVQIRAESLEAYAWDECLEMLEHPEMITQLCLDQHDRLTALDDKRQSEVANLQTARAEQTAAKRRVISLVARGKISEAGAAH